MTAGEGRQRAAGWQQAGWPRWEPGTCCSHASHTARAQRRRLHATPLAPPHPARGWRLPPCHPQPLCCAGSGLEPSGWSIPRGLTLSLCPPHSCPSPPWQLRPVPCGSGGVCAGAEPPQGLFHGGPACSSSLPTTSDPSASSRPTCRRVTRMSQAGGDRKDNGWGWGWGGLAAAR